MGPTVTLLISIGLCLNWAIRAQMDKLSRPILWAVPSSVVLNGADVTLRCHGLWGSDRFQLWKDGELREERNASWQLAEFVLRRVDDFKDARSYRCRYGQGSLWSEFSDSLPLVVMAGAFPAPSIHFTNYYYNIHAGSTVSITCQMSQQGYSQDYTFALLEAKSLEPLQLQNTESTGVYFLLQFVTAEDTGRYKCIYYKKTAPHMGSYPSLPLKLTVSDKLPKPTLWAQSALVMVPGTNITLWCSRPKLPSLEEVTFTLLKAEIHEPLQSWTSRDLWTSFLLPSVRPEVTGSYSCTYRDCSMSARESQPSDALELVVPGSLPKPSLSALPGLLVKPGTHVTLQCRLHPQSSLQRVIFFLLKMGTSRPLQSQRPAGISADFPLISVRAQDAGNYSCVYQRRMTPYQVSEPSDVIEIWVTDALPKPSLSAWPDPEVASGTNVTLRCQGPSWSTKFVLYKEGSNETIQHGSQFFLTHVTSKDSGNYSCSYQPGTNGNLWAQLSNPLEIIVRVPNNSLIIILSCVFFFLLCLLLLACFCHLSIPKGTLNGHNLRRFFCCPCLPHIICLPHHIEAPREEAPYTEVVKKRPREPQVPMAEDSQGITYAQLNIGALNKRKTDHKETPTDSTVYATVSLD